MISRVIFTLLDPKSSSITYTGFLGSFFAFGSSSGTEGDLILNKNLLASKVAFPFEKVPFKL